MQPLLNDPDCVLDRVLQGALPNDAHTPATLAKHCRMACVPVDISLEFLLPEFCVCLWDGGVSTALVPVPETAMNEYHGPVFRKHQIGRARQISDMKPVPKSPGKKTGAKHPFGPGILSADARHHAAALRSGWGSHGLERIPPGYLRRLPLRLIQQNTLTEEVLGAAIGGTLRA